MAQTRARAKQVTFKSDATGGVVRYLHDKLSETVSVKDFGAVGDGVTDDTAAIQAAIDSNYTKSVFVPEGIYLISDTITFNQGIKLHGVRGRSVFRAHPNKSHTSPMFQTTVANAPNRDVWNLYIEQIDFDGASLSFNRWLQDWTDGSTISDPQNDYTSNGGGIGDTGTNYIANNSYIATLQNGTASVALTLANTTMPLGKTTSLSDDFAAARRLRIVSAGDDSGITFTIVGTDYSGAVLSETITGTNASIAEGLKWFKTVSSVTPSGDTDSTVEVGIEEWDIGSAMSAGRRNPAYVNTNALLKLRLTENTTVIDCSFRNHNGTAISEAGGKNVNIYNCLFNAVGKNDGPYHAIWTQSYGNPASPLAGYNDSENISIKGCEFLNVERSAILFSPTRGGEFVNNYISGWGESCIFINEHINTNGGYSRIIGNTMRNGTITDITCNAIEAGRASNLLIDNNFIEGSATAAFVLTGATNITVTNNTLYNCYKQTTEPYGPFSERYAYNIGQPPTAGQSNAIADGMYFSIGTLSGEGGNSILIKGNIITENRTSYPSVFKQTKTGGDYLSGSHIIRDNIFNTPAGMTIYDTTTTGVFDTKIPLWFQNNIGHASEAPVIIDKQFAVSETGVYEAVIGFRPSRVTCYAAANNASVGRTSIGEFTWNNAAVRNDFALTISTDFSAGEQVALLDNDVLRTKDTGGVTKFSAEFTSWTEQGFKINIITANELTNVRFVCHP